MWESTTTDGFDNTPEYVLECLMDVSDVYDSLFVEGDDICVRWNVANGINEDCDDSSPRIGDVFDTFSDDDGVDDADDIGSSVNICLLLWQLN